MAGLRIIGSIPFGINSGYDFRNFAVPIARSLLPREDGYRIIETTYWGKERKDPDHTIYLLPL